MGLYRVDHSVLVFSEVQSKFMQGPFLNPKTGARDQPPSLHAYRCVAVCCSVFQIYVNGKLSSKSANPWEFLVEWRYVWNSHAFLFQRVCTKASFHYLVVRFCSKSRLLIRQWHLFSFCVWRIVAKLWHHLCRENIYSNKIQGAQHAEEKHHEYLRSLRLSLETMENYSSICRGY